MPFDWSALRFGAPDYLSLLLLPGVLTIVWAWQLTRRVQMARLVTRRRHVPVRETLPRTGDLLFWLCLLLATAATIAALARPRAVVGVIRTAGVDLVILQDGSASMHVRDGGAVAAAASTGRPAGQVNRWQRAMSFLREMGESLRWQDDRIALALFAHIATPQIRLTRDPNTFFFFLDHLEDAPPFPLEDDSSWDTNIERGIYWGLRLIQKDEEIRGPTRNARAFVLLSDGQAWSGEVARSVALARERRIPIHVIGVGTTAGGVIPDPARVAGQGPPPIVSSLDRNSLGVIAAAGGGRYFEIEREPDREIATSIIEATRRSASRVDVEEAAEELYWPCLFAAGCLAALGLLFLRERTQLALQVATAGVMLLVLGALIR
ncbi:MAG: VWA domain-containing protein [Vicinamibacterales bacterium]